MTTPEAFRRRQLIEGVMLVVIGILMLGQSLYFQNRADDQQQCIVDNFQELSVALDARSQLTERETEAARRVNLAELAVSSEKEFIAELQRYENEIKAIQKARDENPLPPYPKGQCG